MTIKKDFKSVWIIFTALKHLNDWSSPKWFENAVSLFFFSQLRREIEWKGREASLGEVTQKTRVRLCIDENALLVVKLSSHIDRKKNGGASGISNWPSADCSIDAGLASCGSNYLWRISSLSRLLIGWCLWQHCSVSRSAVWSSASSWHHDSLD